MHVVWDWNGTLFDDFGVVNRAVNRSIAAYGAEPIDIDTHRRLFRRPLNAFYEELLGRPVSDDDMQDIDEKFQAVYWDEYAGADLTDGARHAIERVEVAGGTQSIASMLWHDVLVSIVTRFDLERFMVALDGHRGPVGETKETHLAGHVGGLERLFPVSRGEMVVIGDVVDDAVAASAVGIECVLYDGGSQSRERLEATGFPVVSSLSDALDIVGM